MLFKTVKIAENDLKQPYHNKSEETPSRYKRPQKGLKYKEICKFTPRGRMRVA